MVIEVPDDEPEVPEGSVHVQDVAPGTAAIEYVMHCPLHMFAGPLITVGAAGDDPAEVIITGALDVVHPVPSVTVTV